VRSWGATFLGEASPQKLASLPAWVGCMVGEPDRTNSASEAPFQDSGVLIRGFPPNQKTTRQRNKTGLRKKGYKRFEFILYPLPLSLYPSLHPSITSSNIDKGTWLK